MKKASDLIIAHRGESFIAPENTMTAINLAWQNGAKAVEIDVHLTIDKEIVVIHDADTFRISGIKKRIKKTTLIELFQLNAGFHKGSRWGNEKIPTLKEVLNSIPEKGKLIIELKSNSEILPVLKNELLAYSLKTSQIEIIAFDYKTLAKAKQIMPEYKMLWLLDLDYSLPAWLAFKSTKKIIKSTKKAGFNGVDVWAGKLLTKKFIAKFKNQGLLVYCWTIDNPAKANELLDYGIDGITTNKASWMLEQLNLKQ